MPRANGQEDSPELFHPGWASLFRNSSLPFCCLPNDHFNGLPGECLSQSQLENCWGNILPYWKWFPANCPAPYLDWRSPGFTGLGILLLLQRDCLGPAKSSAKLRSKFQWPPGRAGVRQLTLWSLAWATNGMWGPSFNSWLWESKFSRSGLNLCFQAEALFSCLILNTKNLFSTHFSSEK